MQQANNGPTFLPLSRVGTMMDSTAHPNAPRTRDNCYLFTEETVPEQAAFPVVDAHNHLWAQWETLENVVRVMDAVGVRCYADLTANISLRWGQGGYVVAPGRWDTFLEQCLSTYPRRFYGFTTATFCQPPSQPLFDDAGEFVERTLTVLRDHVRRGARGLKILKEFGLHYRDSRGALLVLDDPRFDPIWKEAGKLGVPVLMHQSDPYGFHQPISPDNEHAGTLAKYPSWSFASPEFPSKEELLARRDAVIARHPGTVFLLPHVANFAENLPYVGRLLDENPNVFIDPSARLDELGRQPYATRELFLKYQDRIYFGTDMPASVEMYRCYFRFFETRDEHFVPPDYDGTFARFRWRICGIGLPEDVLEKLYWKNALRLIPGLERQVSGHSP